MKQAPQCQLDGCSLAVHVDEHTGRVHDYCSRRHADLGLARGGPSAQAPCRRAEPVSTKGTAECRLEGCKELVYRDPETKVVSGLRRCCVEFVLRRKPGRMRAGALG